MCAIKITLFLIIPCCDTWSYHAVELIYKTISEQTNFINQNEISSIIKFNWTKLTHNIYLFSFRSVEKCTDSSRFHGWHNIRMRFKWTVKSNTFRHVIMFYLFCFCFVCQVELQQLASWADNSYITKWSEVNGKK